MVKFSAITLPALLAALATLSAAAPTPNTSSDVVATNAVAARDVEPVDFSADSLEAREVSDDIVETVSIDARTNHGSNNHWGYDGHWWYKKSGKWYKDSKKYNKDYDQEYKHSHHMSYYGRDGYKYEWKNDRWSTDGKYYEQYSSSYWNNNYKRDVSAVADAADLEARTNHGSANHWGYDGHWWYKKDGKWYKDSKYNQDYDQGYKKSRHMKYYGNDGYMYEWKNDHWYKYGKYYEQYDSKYWNGHYKRDVSEVDARDVEVEARDVPTEIDTSDYAIEARDVEVEAEEPADFALETRTNGDKHKDHKDYYSYHGYRHHWNGKSWEKCEYNGWYNKEYKPYYKSGYLYEYSYTSKSYERCGNYNQSYKDGYAW